MLPVTMQQQDFQLSLLWVEQSFGIASLDVPKKRHDFKKSIPFVKAAAEECEVSLLQGQQGLLIGENFVSVDHDGHYEVPQGSPRC